ncbi:MAG: FGLLP motif-containing membrane protein [Acidimicrobiales bacterium]
MSVVLLSGAAAATAKDQLVVNGTFNQGPRHFSSQYATGSSAGDLGNPGTLAVGTDPATFNGAWPTMSPLSPATKMLIVNGSTTAGETVWSETVPVATDSTYVFSLYATSLYTTPAVLEFQINGRDLGSRPCPTSIASWKQLSVTWHSQTATTATLSIFDTELAFGGNDFAIDDVSLLGDAAVPSGNVAPIAATIGTPRQIFHSMGHNLLNAIITVALVVLIAFPANIFNQTFSDNYAEILLMVASARRRFRHPFAKPRGEEAASFVPHGEESTGNGAASTTPGRATPARFAVSLVIGAFLGGLLNPKFGSNAQTVEDLVATVAAFLFAATVSWFVAKSFRRYRHYSTTTYLRALPLGLLVAAVCVVVSRLTNFEPGYLYGVVIGFAFVGSLKDRHTAHLVAISTLSTLLVALLAWLAWVPVSHLALDSGNAVVAMVDDMLGSIFIGGLVGSVVGMLPLEGLPGGHLAKWRRDVWAIVFFLATFLLVEVELNPATGPTHPGGAPVVTAILLFVIFGALSLGTRSYFIRRKARQDAEHARRPVAP